MHPTHRPCLPTPWRLRATALPFLAAAGSALLALAAAPAAAEPRRYTLDPTHSFVYFEVLHFGTSTIRGHFGPMNGEVTLDREARRGRVQLVIEPARVSTGLAVLDARLRGSDFFDVEAHPQAFFVAERFTVDEAGQVQAVRGELTVKGIGRALELAAVRYRCYTSPLFRREVCGGDFEAELPRSAFGMSFGLPLIADTVRLKVQVEAIHQP